MKTYTNIFNALVQGSRSGGLIKSSQMHVGLKSNKHLLLHSIRGSEQLPFNFTSQNAF